MHKKYFSNRKFNFGTFILVCSAHMYSQLKLTLYIKEKKSSIIISLNSAKISSKSVEMGKLCGQETVYCRF